MFPNNAAEQLQALYDSEINFVISTFWDGGFDWRLGDEMNGFKADGSGTTLNEAVQDLCEAARIHFPLSNFTKGVSK